MVMNGVKIGRILMILAPFDAKSCELAAGIDSGPIRAPQNFEFFLGGGPQKIIFFLEGGSTPPHFTFKEGGSCCGTPRWTLEPTQMPLS